MRVMKVVYKFPPYLSEEYGRMFNVLVAHGFRPVAAGPPAGGGACCEIALPEESVPALKMLVKSKPGLFANHLKEDL